MRGGNKRDTKGERIEDVVASHALCVLNDSSYTYLRREREELAAASS